MPKALPEIKKQLIKYNDKSMVYTIPNGFCKWRVKTLFTKEPETIEWLASFKPQEVFWDIGANIGLYSIFATVVAEVQTFAFEPESNNYQILNNNIFHNNLHFRIKAYPLALSNTKGLGELFLSEPEGGHSGHDIRKPGQYYLKYNQGCVITSGDALIRMGVPAPDHVKIDVDGVEPLILEGLQRNLHKVKSLLVEINLKDPRHMKLVQDMLDRGFEYDQDQVDRTQRSKDQSPYFQSFREFIFKRRV